MTHTGLLILLHFLLTLLIVVVRAILICGLGYGAVSILRELLAVRKYGEGRATCLEMFRWWLYIGLGVSGLCTMGLK